jgi:hypothetical protein
MTSLGSGVGLDESFDFEVGSTGDLKSTEGVEELEKDLAFQMVLGLDEFIGRRPTAALPERVARRASDIAEADPRVEFVNRSALEASFSPDARQIDLKMQVKTEDGVQELIFNV